MAVGSLVVKLGLDAVDYINGFNKAEQQAAKFAETSKKTSASIDRQVKSLQLQADLLGKSAREAKLYELAQKGATQAQLDSANAALRQVEAFEKATVIGRNLGIALAAGAAAAVAGFIKLKEVVGVLDDLDEAADAAGTTAVSLANLRRAALDAGVDASQLDKALTKLNTTMSDAASGNEKAIEKFRPPDDLIAILSSGRISRNAISSPAHQIRPGAGQGPPRVADRRRVKLRPQS